MLEIKGSQSQPGKAGAQKNLWERLRGTVIVLVIVAVVVGAGGIFAWVSSQHAGDVSNAKYINLGGSGSKAPTTPGSN